MTDQTGTVDRWLHEVASEVGLDDFGDPSFRVGLDRLVAAADAEAALNDIGRAALEGQVRSTLANRLRITDWFRRHPEVGEERIEQPLIIVGQPRSGTTALSHLLGADPANRSLLMWEAVDSVPPPRAETYETDPRYEADRNKPDMLGMLNPGFKAIHHDPPDAPVECTVLLSQHFMSLQLSTMFNIPSYDEWLLAADRSPAYDYHRRVLQLLQSACPGRWQLKSPVHCLGIDALDAHYPDALLVWPHRDPVKIVGSVCSLVRSLSGTFTDADHTAYIASHWFALMAELSDRMLAFRRRVGDDRFGDVAYRDLVDDPVGTVRALYDRFGIPFTDDAERGMRAWASERPQHQYGRHTYTLEEFGLSADAIRERFADYLETFDVPPG